MRIESFKKFMEQAASNYSRETQRELLIFFVLGGLGAVASQLNVRIPHTEAFIEVRWAFGFMAFALFRRLWPAIILGAILSVLTPAGLPLHICLAGNMLYVLPSMAAIRVVKASILDRTDNLILYGIGWFLTMMACYQVFLTPVMWGLIAVLKNEPVWASVLAGWVEQPYFVEALLSGIILASGMTVFRSLNALRRSRHELAITLDAMDDGVIATDAEGRVKRMNPAARAMTGWHLEELRGRPLQEIFHIVNARTRHTASNPVQRVIRDGVVCGLANDTCLISRDGTEYQIADSAAPIKEPDGSVIGTVMVFREVKA